MHKAFDDARNKKLMEERQSIIDAYEEAHFTSYKQEDLEVQRYIIGFKRYVRSAKLVESHGGLSVGYGIAYSPKELDEQGALSRISSKMVRDNLSLAVWGIVAAWIMDSDDPKAKPRQIYGKYNEDTIPIDMMMTAAKTRVRRSKPRIKVKNPPSTEVTQIMPAVRAPLKPPTPVVKSPFTIARITKDIPTQEVA